MEIPYKIITYDASYKTAWDSFCKQSKNSTFLFERDFMEYHSDRFEDHSLLVYKGEKLVALLPANSVGDEIYSHQGLTYGGLVLSPKTKLTETIAICKSILQALETKGITKLYIKQLPSFYASLPSDEFEYLAFLLKARTTRVDTAAVIDYSNQLNIQSNRLEGVKKANKAGLEIKEETTFDLFWDAILLPNLSQRHQAIPTHTASEIGVLHKHFPKNIRQFNVYKDGVIVGGATVFDTRTTAHVQYISGNDQKQELGTLDFLFEHLINETFKHKRFFDFGISNEQAGTKLNKGLSYWKECFGARTYVHRFYEIETAHHTFLDSVYL